MTDYVTAKDIVIPKGTKVFPAPYKVNRFVPFGSVLIGVTKDTTAEWAMPIDEALETGMIVEATVDNKEQNRD